jgi:tyrosyl-tRNA synthetase
MTSPFVLFQYLLNVDDASTPASLRYFTFLSPTRYSNSMTRRNQSLKSVWRNAPLLTKWSRWCMAATPRLNAESASEAIFSDAIGDLDEETLLEVVRDAPSSVWSREEFRCWP